MGKDRRVKIISIVFLVGGITFLHYFTELKAHHYHILYQGIYFLPVILGGFWFGLRGGLVTSLGITGLYLPFSLLAWDKFSATDFNNAMEMILYNVVAVILGKLRDRERAGQKHLRETERLTAMGKAVAGLAHDIKAPLIAISGLIRQVRRDVKEDDLHWKKLDFVTKEIKRLEVMVKEILDFSRPLELNLSKGDIHQLINESLAIISDLAERKSIKIETHFPRNSPLVTFDACRMKEALINLLMNSIEASIEGGTVVLRTYQERRKVIIDVTDFGCGIPDNKKDEIFFPFYTTKKGGTGLGLPSAKKIVDAHQGYLQVLDGSDKGATFRIIIPAE